MVIVINFINKLIYVVNSLRLECHQNARLPSGRRCILRCQRALLGAYQEASQNGSPKTFSRKDIKSLKPTESSPRVMRQFACIQKFPTIAKQRSRLRPELICPRAPCQCLRHRRSVLECGALNVRPSMRCIMQTYSEADRVQAIASNPPVACNIFSLWLESNKIFEKF